MKLLLACLFWTTVGTLFGTWGRISGDEALLRRGARTWRLLRSLMSPGRPIQEPPEETPPAIDDPDPDEEPQSPPQPPSPVPPVTPVP